MRVRRRQRSRSHWMVMAATSSAVVAVTGCSMMNPYDHVSLVPPPAAPDAAPARFRLAGGADEGLRVAESMRQTYFNNLKYTSYLRNGTAVLAGTLTGWTIYNATKPDGAGSGASEANTRRGVRLGATLATLYGLREVFVNPEQDAAYVAGYQALTCLMLQSSPLLMTQFDPKSGTGGQSSQPPAPTGAAYTPAVRVRTDDIGDADWLEASLNRLEQTIFRVHKRVAQDALRADAFAEGDADVAKKQAYLHGQIKATRKALSYARTSLAEGRALLHSVDHVGAELTKRVGLVVSAVNGQVQSTQRDVAGAADALTKADDLLGTVRGLGGGTEADQADIATASAQSAAEFWLWPASMPSIRLAGPMSTAVDVLLAQAPVAQAGTPSVVKKKPAGTGPVKSKALPAEVVADAATAAELQAIRDALDAALKAMAERKAKADQAELLKKKQEEIDRLQAAMTKMKTQALWEQAACSNNEIGCAASLAAETEELFADRRPVAQALLNFRRAVRQVGDTPECNELAALRVTPSEPFYARPGDTVSFFVSQRDKGNPSAFMNGPTDEKSGIKFSFNGVEGSTAGLFRADLTVGPDMKRQQVRVVFSNSKGTARREVVLLAGATAASASSPAPTASAASAPSAGDAKAK
ncbi:hypothetical protein MW290_12480 [Aquincola tertiaricarbonis]|uniref:Uncharacterized protein n=1 Tax=Aquincola tertiaricarbonis TaxID=391953 RepID=A0ABY4S090_AQUTE|nr:hypothetical protein [Aquincola tertiaricarbonis]URI06713.1 hypothetical protein MW290_12480 [Aquincola tertiaricarbonis]